MNDENGTWERRHTFQDLSLAAVADHLRPVFGEGASRITSAVPLTGAGLMNTNYKVTREGRDNSPVVLRLYAAGNKPEEVCARETAVLGLAARHGIPVPGVLFADPDGAHLGHAYAVTTFIEGTLLRDVMARGGADALAAGRAAGETRAALSRITFAHEGFFGPDLTIPNPFPPDPAANARAYIARCLSKPTARERLGDDLACRTERLLETRQTWLDAALREISPRPCLVHADYQSTNLLVREEKNGSWRVSGVLDWEFAHAGSPLFDLAILLRNRGETLAPGFANAVADGYTNAGGRLPEDWQRAARLLDLVNLCDFLASPEAGPAMVAAVRAVIQNTATELA